MSAQRTALLIVGATLALGACTDRELIVLLPEDDGSVGRLAVEGSRSGTAPVELSEPFAAARVGGALGSGLRGGSLTLEQIEARFGDVTAILPAEAESFVLYFETGQASLTDADLALLEAVRVAMAARPAAEIEVVGHTDTVGAAELNDALSVDRALAARAALIDILDIPPDRITAAGRGERQLAEPTADDMANPRNRRVELRLR